MNPANSRRESRRESSHPSSGTTSQSQFLDAPSHSESKESIASVTSHKGFPLSTTPSSKSIHTVQKEQRASKLPPKKPTESQKMPTRQLSKKIKLHASIKKRAEGRTKVPERFRDSFQLFVFSTTGMLKVLRMCIVAASVFCFVIGGAHEMFIAITIQETCIVLFFVIIYLVTLQHLLICIHWPLLDFINSLISAVFLGVVALITIQEKQRRHLCFIGGILCLSATILCLIDALLVSNEMRKNRKQALRL
ncbi:CKLF-like MARVEL transmembrane domain-containing protein 2 [Chionomys nivalis]|uniref:CKLF-like MARVEL transmembrane domain-containing protein 2 n=1 Tax=Chionomys nivalis TaxID=269649 RepID=UPI002597A11A|nr:CKLF-like MARVEL transmembrane domain-containing protein 2 [Chionomys nivalis]